MWDKQTYRLEIVQKFFAAQWCYRPIRIKHSKSVCNSVPLPLLVLFCSCITLVNSSPLPIFFGALLQQLNTSAQKDRVTGKYHGTPMPYFPDWEKNTLDYNSNIVIFTCKINMSKFFLSDNKNGCVSHLSSSQIPGKTMRM